MMTFNNRYSSYDQERNRPSYNQGIGLNISYNNYTNQLERIQINNRNYLNTLKEQIEANTRYKEEQKRRKKEEDKRDEERLAQERRILEMKARQEDSLRLSYLRAHEERYNRNKKKDQFIRDLLASKRAYYQYFKRYLSYDENVFDKIREMQGINHSIYRKDCLKEFAKMKNDEYTRENEVYRKLYKVHKKNIDLFYFKDELMHEMKKWEDERDSKRKKELIYDDYIKSVSQSQQIERKRPQIEPLPYINYNRELPDVSKSSIYEGRMINGLHQDNRDIDELNQPFDLQAINNKLNEKLNKINVLDEETFM